MATKSKGKNKGEWSEFYAFMRILADQTLPAANSDLSAIPDKFFIFKKIYRSNEIEYSWSENDVLVSNSNGTLLARIPRALIGTKAKIVFEAILVGGGRGAFILPEATEIMSELLCESVSASSEEKADIDAIIEDRVSQSEERLGFSIKSMVGGAATLLNASKDQTNFCFEVSGIEGSKIEQINMISGRSKIKDRMQFIKQNGGKLNFTGMCSESFSQNLRKIDTMMPEFLAQMLVGFYGGQLSKLRDIVHVLSDDEIFTNKFSLSYADYCFKIQQLLIAATLGMVPSKPWDGLTKVQGGYIVVKSTGEVVCYHLYNRDLFLEYLLTNTKFETPSTKRHGFGDVYINENGSLAMKLNLQIRFTN